MERTHLCNLLDSINVWYKRNAANASQLQVMDDGGGRQNAGPIGEAEEGIKEQENARCNRNTVCEVVVLSVAIGFSWMLLLLAIIFYHLPDEVYSRVSM